MKKKVELTDTTAKMIAFEHVYEELAWKGGDRKLYRLTKQRKRSMTWSASRTRMIVLVEEAYIRQRWQTNFHWDRDIVLGELARFEPNGMDFWKNVGEESME